MALISDSLSVWEISFRWAGYDPDRYCFSYPLEVKDNFKILMEAIISGEIYCETMMLAKRPSNSKADPKYYIRSYTDDIYACVWGHKYNKKLLKWAQISRGDFHEWCERRGIPEPEFWFPKGWKYDFEWPEYGTRAFWAKHVEPSQEGGFSVYFDIPEEGETKNFKYLISNNDSNEDVEAIDTSSLRPNQLIKRIVQKIAIEIWKEHPEDNINISQMARHEVIHKYSGAASYGVDAVKKWIREVAPVKIKGKRGRPRRNIGEEIP